MLVWFLNMPRSQSVAPQIRWKALRQILAVALCLSMAGCGSDLVQVSGFVTQNGKPLRGGESIRATVVFQPVSGTGATAMGIVDENGEYFLSTGSQDGIKPGEYIVTCSASELIPSKDPHGTPGGRRISDPKYASAQTSGLRFTVQPGNNEFNITLD